MPFRDSIQSIADTVLNLKQDSLLKPDSALVSESINPADANNIPFVGFDGILHPSFPSNEKWVFITLMILFALSVFSFLRSSGWFIESFRTFFQIKERGSIFNKSTLSDFQSRTLLIVFSIGVFSLYSYVILFTPGNKFEFRTYLLLLGATSAFFLIKYLLIKIAGYVFIQPSIEKIAVESYFNLLSYLSIFLFPLLVFHIYFPGYLIHYVSITSLVLCCLASLTLIIKLFLIFFEKIATILYIFLYLCTLEIVPVVLLFYAYQFIIKSV